VTGSVDAHAGLRRAARALGVRGALKAMAGRLGFFLVRADYYSPVPDIEALPEGFWTQPRELLGVDLELDAQRAFLEQELAPYIAEFAAGGAPTDFHSGNGLYDSVDAELLYAIVRHRRPRHVIELGSGMSTLVLGAALARNRADGVNANYRAFDPYPRPALEEAVGRTAILERRRSEELGLEPFAALEPGDILFVDTTHTVKAGNDVLHIVLDVLPSLAPGVLVHFHDIFLPWEYPRRWLVEDEYYWAEQYLLHAFLMFNERYRVLLSAHALTRAFPDTVRRLIPSFSPEGPGGCAGAFWLVRSS
jgi:predicted O-methyltransferase YrrM